MVSSAANTGVIATENASRSGYKPSIHEELPQSQEKSNVVTCTRQKVALLSEHILVGYYTHHIVHSTFSSLP